MRNRANFDSRSFLHNAFFSFIRGLSMSFRIRKLGAEQEYVFCTKTVSDSIDTITIGDSISKFFSGPCNESLKDWQNLSNHMLVNIVALPKATNMLRLNIVRNEHQ